MVLTGLESHRGWRRDKTAYNHKSVSVSLASLPQAARSLQKSQSLPNRRNPFNRTSCYSPAPPRVGLGIQPKESSRGPCTPAYNGG
jgi:hypothetical protein